ncbi:DUF6683 family protein [Pseudonocardia sp. TMWB2A]|uniref:DUF6683 family protein n=1 Tax=Pseudonocardia sp. TMWB2A TaxID=687430 RepID=UPI00307FA061
MKVKIAAITLLAITSTAGNAQQYIGQYIGQADWNMGFQGADIIGNSINEQMLEDNSNSSSNKDNAPRQTVAKAITLTYTPSMSVRKQNYAAYVQQLRKMDDASATQAAQFLASNDIVEQLDGAMRPMGLRANNVADAFTLWWVIAWHAANGRQGEPSPSIMATVKRQAASALSATPQLASASNTVKQEMAESLLIQAALIDAALDDAKGDRTKTAALARAVNQGAQKIGLDLTKFNLTQDGFVPRSGGRSDAGDAAGDDSQLATNDDGAQAEGASMGDYALYAVAGTGLLAGMFALGKGFSKKG